MSDKTPNKATKKALRLTLGGAPQTPHFVPGVPGLFRPDKPTLVGEGIDLAYAKKLHDDPSIPLELVDVGAEEAKELRELQKRDLEDARHGILDARKQADGAEVELVRDAAKAIS